MPSRYFVDLLAVEEGHAAVQPIAVCAVERDVLANGDVRRRGARVREGALLAIPHSAGLHGSAGGLGGSGRVGARGVPVRVVAD